MYNEQKRDWDKQTYFMFLYLLAINRPIHLNIGTEGMVGGHTIFYPDRVNLENQSLDDLLNKSADLKSQSLMNQQLSKIMKLVSIFSELVNRKA